MNQLKVIIACIVIASNSLLMQTAMADTITNSQRYSETVFATTVLENNSTDKLLAQGARAFLINKQSENLSIEKSLC